MISYKEFAKVAIVIDYLYMIYDDYSNQGNGFVFGGIRK